MSQYQICPYWICESRNLPGTAQRDLQITELKITNPSDTDAVLELVFYEVKADGNFYRADWASGRWAAPAKWQRVYRPDPSGVYGSAFYLYGWIEIWMSSNDMVADVSVAKISRNALPGELQTHSQRTLTLINRRIPWPLKIKESVFGTSLSPLRFPIDTRTVPIDRTVFDPNTP